MKLSRIVNLFNEEIVNNIELIDIYSYNNEVKLKYNNGEDIYTINVTCKKIKKLTEEVGNENEQDD